MTQERYQVFNERPEEPGKSRCRAVAMVGSVIPMTPLECDKETVFFMADAHLGLDPGGDPARVRAISSFFSHVMESRGALFILGDFFDFWFEYRSVIPREHFVILKSLADLISSGIEVNYVGGNHDFWIGDFLRNTVGLRAFAGAVDLTCQGRRAFLSHGDGLAQRDRLYPLLRGFLHSRPVTALYGLLHPDLGLPLARWFSKLSRGYNTDWAPDSEALWRDVAVPRFEAGFDAVILGHVHKPLGMTRRQGSLFVLGDWINRFTYLVLSDGDFKRLKWNGAPSELHESL